MRMFWSQAVEIKCQIRRFSKTSRGSSGKEVSYTKRIVWVCNRCLREEENPQIKFCRRFSKNQKGWCCGCQKALLFIMKDPRKTLFILMLRGTKNKEKGSPPFYELVVRNPVKGKSPFPVATYLTCDHTTASVTYFLEAFLTDVTRLYGQQGGMSPIMIMCDGSMVLMQAISLSCARKGFNDAIDHYYNIASGQGTKADFKILLLDRCLSHIMKNTKDMCR